jgi:hypothetical protein
MSLLLFAVVVILILCLACWVVTLLPVPTEPPHLKSILMAVLTIIAIVVIIQRAGWLGAM